MKKFILSLAACMVMFAAFAGPVAAQIDVFPNCTVDANGKPVDDNVICNAKKDKLFGAGSIWSNILNFFTYIIGAVSVLMITIGGIRYTTSNGEPAQLTSAKNTILYAVIGLIVAIMANAIVNFVLTNI